MLISYEEYKSHGQVYQESVVRDGSGWSPTELGQIYISHIGEAFIRHSELPAHKELHEGTIEWESLEISSRKLEIPRGHFMQR